MDEDDDAYTYRGPVYKAARRPAHSSFFEEDGPLQNLSDHVNDLENAARIRQLGHRLNMKWAKHGYRGAKVAIDLLQNSNPETWYGAIGDPEFIRLSHTLTLTKIRRKREIKAADLVAYCVPRMRQWFVTGKLLTGDELKPGPHAPFIYHVTNVLGTSQSP